jgi:hypothetical protein
MTESIREEPTERAIVARGRTVVVPDPSVPSVFVGREPDTHREIFAQECAKFLLAKRSRCLAVK